MFDMEEKKLRMELIIYSLNESNKSYYATGESILSVKAFDDYYDELFALERETGIVLSDSPTARYEPVTHTKTFIAFDFETANQNHPPCSVGIAIVSNGVIVDRYHSLINPKQRFSDYCVEVHGITESDVVNAPTFKEIWKEVGYYFHHYPVVAHNAGFDKFVLEKAAKRHDISLPPIIYYDTMKLFRKNYLDESTFSLSSICAFFDIEFDNHHNALSDAEASAKVMLKLCEDKSNKIFISFDGYEITNKEKENNLSPTSSTLDNDCIIIFEGSAFVLTGVVDGYDREEIEYEIVKRGGSVRGSVSKKTDYVVTGLQNISIVRDKQNAKSSKLIRAEELRSEGCAIKIVSFEKLLKAFLDIAISI